jgi:uncharacterized membrane protein
MNIKKMTRIYSIDLLRGIAVILMVQQHTGYWFWNAGGDMGSLIGEYPVMVIINGLGGLAAPLFILLAGIGAALSIEGGKSGKQLILRGLMIIFYGYLLNILTPAWFSPVSWYVLHLIGSGMILSPVFRRFNPAVLLTISGVILFLSVFFLNAFNTPRYLDNDDMRGINSITGVCRLVFFEGHFPLLPWIALFITGFISGRWIADKAYISILKAVAGFFAAAILLYLIKQGDFGFLKNTFGARLLLINLYMYPAYPIQFLTLSSVSLICVYLVLLAGMKFKIPSGNILILTGRVSLTVFILHIIIIRNFMVKSGLWQTFSEPATVMLQIAVLLFIFVAVYFWRKIEFRYGFEWLLRLI